MTLSLPSTWTQLSPQLLVDIDSQWTLKRLHAERRTMAGEQVPAQGAIWADAVTVTFDGQGTAPAIITGGAIGHSRGFTV